ncbi:MAG TPA: hypothetical protein VN784_02575 [Candidatus Limnocylindrales bacterium]|nr:hypothetical protein [Candidatus Limnocylindrales bacterium]
MNKQRVILVVAVAVTIVSGSYFISAQGLSVVPRFFCAPFGLLMGFISPAGNPPGWIWIPIFAAVMFLAGFAFYVHKSWLTTFVAIYLFAAALITFVAGSVIHPTLSPLR